MRCAICGAPADRTLENPAWKRPQIMGSNTKIWRGRAAAVDLPPGPTGTCRRTTPACSSCYAQLGDIVFGSSAVRRQRTLEVFLGDRNAWIDAVVEDIENVRPPVVRIHGFGDFFSTEYVEAWHEVATRLPKMRFFGTTRMWQSDFSRDPEEKAFVCALDAFRALPNVFIGASVEGSGYDPSTETFIEGDRLARRVPGTGRYYEGNRRGAVRSGAAKGKLLLDYLRSRGFTIWNMISEFSDPVARKEMDVRVASGKTFADQMKEQFVAARAIGAMVGLACPEQQRKVLDCATCGHCLHKTDGTEKRDVSFAFHPGKSLKQQLEEEDRREAMGMPRSKHRAAQIEAGRNRKNRLSRKRRRIAAEISRSAVKDGGIRFDVRVGEAAQSVQVNPPRMRSGWVKTSAAGVETFVGKVGSLSRGVRSNPQKRRPSGFSLMMRHVPNVDIAGRGGYWDDRPGGSDTEVVYAVTLADAAHLYTSWIQRLGLGNGNIAAGSGYVTRNSDGATVARISYNGRVWTPHEFGDPNRREFDLRTGKLRVLGPCDACGAPATHDDITAGPGPGHTIVRHNLCAKHRISDVKAKRTRKNPYELTESSSTKVTSKAVTWRCHAVISDRKWRMSKDYLYSVVKPLVRDMMKKLDETAITHGPDQVIVNEYTNGYVGTETVREVIIDFQGWFEAPNTGANRDLLEKKVAAAFRTLMAAVMVQVRKDTGITKWTGRVEAK